MALSLNLYDQIQIIYIYIGINRFSFPPLIQKGIFQYSFLMPKEKEGSLHNTTSSLEIRKKQKKC